MASKEPAEMPIMMSSPTAIPVFSLLFSATHWGAWMALTVETYPFENEKINKLITLKASLVMKLEPPSLSMMGMAIKVNKKIVLRAERM